MTVSPAMLSSGEKKELLRALLAERMAGARTGPASPARARLWRLDRQRPGNPAFAAFHALRLRGALDAEALGRALAEVVRRHDALRTVVVAGPGEQPLQRVLASTPVSLPVEDLTAVAPPELRARIDAEGERRFDLAAGPLLRATLLRTGPDEHVLLLAVHHAAADEAGVGTVLAEWAAAYAALVRGEAPELAEPAPEPAAVEADAAGASWWADYLDGAPTVLSLAGGHPRPPVPAPRRGVRRFRLDAALTARLRALAAEEEAGVSDVLLAAFAFLLHRATGERELVVGVAGTGPRAGILPLRAGVSPELTFRALLRQVRDDGARTRAHGGVPLDAIARAARPEGADRHDALFQAAFAWGDPPEAGFRLPGIDLTALPFPRRGHPFDLALRAWTDGDGTAVELEYAADLFDAAGGERMAADFAAVAAAGAGAPGTALAVLPLPRLPAAAAFPASAHLRLPNGMTVVPQSRVEAEHFYEDLFEKRIYLRHGISLSPGDCVLDVGGNIGMFALYASRAAAGGRIYTFEPAPPLFARLRANLALNAADVVAFNHGIAEAERTARFTFYPNSSGMSSFYPDAEEERDILRLMMEHRRREGGEGLGDLMEHTEELLDWRFQPVEMTCRLRPLSAVIREEGIERVDFLKIDVQKAEMDVLRGIDDEHWPMIRQVVMEVHDLDGRLEAVRRLLEARGFRVSWEQDDVLEGSILYNLFALRETAG